MAGLLQACFISGSHLNVLSIKLQHPTVLKQWDFKTQHYYTVFSLNLANLVFCSWGGRKRLLQLLLTVSYYTSVGDRWFFSFITFMLHLLQHFFWHMPTVLPKLSTVSAYGMRTSNNIFTTPGFLCSVLSFQSCRFHAAAVSGHVMDVQVELLWRPHKQEALRQLSFEVGWDESVESVKAVLCIATPFFNQHFVHFLMYCVF